MRHAKPEQELHIRVASLLTTCLPAQVLWSSIGHGGGGRIRGAILKSMGVRPGVPDIALFLPDGRVLWIELKSAKGHISPEQKKWLEHAHMIGHGAEICRSVDEVIEALVRFKVPNKIAKAAA